MTTQNYFQDQIAYFEPTTEPWFDDFAMSTDNENDFFDALAKTESNSTWVEEVKSRGLRVHPTICMDINDMMANENIARGTGLTLSVNGEDRFISEIARKSLYDTAKISGSALGRLSLNSLADILNECLAVANGNSLMLIRYGKVMSLHGAKYLVIPMTDTFNLTKDLLKNQFGTISFVHGFHSNRSSQAVWSLDDKREDFAAAYKKALKDSIALDNNRVLTPVARLTMSDTANNAITLDPLALLPNGECISFVNGISVKHERRTDLEGLDLYVDLFKDFYVQLNKGFEIMQKMANTEIWHPENTFIGICNALNRKTAGCIARKYADAAREEIVFLAQNSESCLSMYDIYLSMTEITRAARKMDATRLTINNIEEAIARVRNLNWSNYDVGGVVAWGK